MGQRDKLVWYINRLKLMSPSEICYRAGESLSAPIRSWRQAQIKKQQFNYQSRSRYFFSERDLTDIRAFYADNPDLKARLLAQADSALAHRVTLFGLQNLFLGEQIDWHRDYESGKRCEPGHYSRLDYRDEAVVGDVKYTWELNRFQHLYCMAQAFVVTAEAYYAEEIVTQLLHWIDTNPYLMGINWTSANELALRLIAWGWALKTLDIMKWPLSSSIRTRIATSIYQQAEYIETHLSRFSSANNHLVGEAAGLLMTGLTFDFGPASTRWIALGSRILREELYRQHSADGLNREQALEYHVYGIDFYLLAFLLLRLNRPNALPEDVWQFLKRTITVLSVWLDDAGAVPPIGDSDNAWVAQLLHEATPQRRVESLFNTAALSFEMPELKALGGHRLDEKTLWLLGPQHCAAYAAWRVDAPPLQSSVHLQDSGYVVFRDEKTRAWMDIAPLGYLSIAAHGHADALSVGFSYDGKPFLIDPGTYAYHTQGAWRDYFRGTAAHNTVMVDGRSQSVSGGNFMWLQKADVQLKAVQLDEVRDRVRASHNGYLKQRLGVIHEREVLFIKNVGLLVMDTLKNPSRKPHRYTVSWHLHPDCKVQRKTEEILHLYNAGRQIQLHRERQPGPHWRLDVGNVWSKTARNHRSIRGSSVSNRSHCQRLVFGGAGQPGQLRGKLVDVRCERASLPYPVNGRPASRSRRT